MRKTLVILLMTLCCLMSTVAVNATETAASGTAGKAQEVLQDGVIEDPTGSDSHDKYHIEIIECKVNTNAATSAFTMPELDRYSYSKEINYLDEMYKAAKDGSAQALNLGSIYEDQRNLKITSEGVSSQTTDFFAQGLPAEEIQKKIEAYMMEAAAAKKQTVPAGQKLSSDGTYKGNFVITYYCPCTSCSEGWGRQTSSGVQAVEGVTVAADTNVLPFGTKIYIEGVGTRVVQDRGGAIRGNRIDVYVSSHSQCNANGKHQAAVYVVK